MSKKARIVKGKRTSRYSEVEKLAYRQGLIERGKKNPNSRVYEAYQRGLNGIPKTEKKPLV